MYRIGSLDTPHVQLILDQSMVPPPLQNALNRINARVSIRSLDKALVSGVSSTADVCVILPGAQGSPDVLDRILADASHQACATMVLPGIEAADPPSEIEQESASGLLGRAAAEPAAVTMSTDELTGHIKALCEIRHPLCRLRDELARLRRRHAELASGARQFKEQLSLAGQIQNDLLPEPLLDTGPLTISTLYLPADRVSGDIYDISRLDEERLSFSIADATGHGLPAALLTIFIKNSLRGREIVDGSYRIIEPDQLLERLNRDLLGTNLTQCQFITALNAIFDRTTGRIRWARGGVPYPILIRSGEKPRQIPSEGGLIGAFSGQSFEVVTHDFAPGDTLLFYTDGLEALLMTRRTGHNEASLLQSTWIDRLAIDGPQTALAEIHQEAINTPDTDWPKDDITAIAIRMN